MRKLQLSVLTVFAILGVYPLLRFYINHRQPYIPSRPYSISAEATYIQGPNGQGLWESCHILAAGIECVIASASGSILREGQFIPYKGMGPTTQSQLVITQRSGEGWVSLVDGTYLIPAQNNKSSRRYLDFMVGDAKHF